MNITGNTILITGGGSGIGRGLAQELHALGNQVVIAGRRREALDETTAANPGIKSLTLDVESPAAIRAFAAQAAAEFPALNVLINNAGIMRPEDLLKQEDLTNAEAIVTTNLLGPIRLTAALLPHLLAQPQAAIVNVSSGLAFLPLAVTPTYCATKAAIHSYTQSLRYQLRKTQIEVIELIPPYVATHLMSGANDPRAMPLDKFIAEVMAIFKTQPTPAEICVENVKGLRYAAASGRYDAIFAGLNEARPDGH
ncbi:MAG: SDR family NAD(P)-dependent oxidoreductase [Terracidiphilus sp.]